MNNENEVSESERMEYVLQCASKPLGYYLPWSLLNAIGHNGKNNFESKFLHFMLRSKSNELELESLKKEFKETKDKLEYDIHYLTRDFNQVKRERDRLKKQLAKLNSEIEAEEESDVSADGVKAGSEA